VMDSRATIDRHRPLTAYREGQVSGKPLENPVPPRKSIGQQRTMRKSDDESHALRHRGTH
jgi:hypothetical protein